MAKAWYVIHTYSGYESKVKASIEQRLQFLGMQEVVSQILIPSQDVFEHKKGQKHVINKKFFPGYILAEMEMTDETWYIIKNTPKVTGFVGAGSKPTPMSQKEVEIILEQMKSGVAKPKAEILFDKGDRIKIIEGPFTSFTGQVDEVNEDREKVRVLVSIFGRSTPVELDFGQIERI